MRGPWDSSCFEDRSCSGPMRHRRGRHCHQEDSDDEGHGRRGPGGPCRGHGPHWKGPHGHGPLGHGPFGHGPFGHGPFGHGPFGHGPFGHSPFGHGPHHHHHGHHHHGHHFRGPWHFDHEGPSFGPFGRFGPPPCGGRSCCNEDRCQKQKKNKPSCSKDKDGNATETVFVQRIVVEQPARASSV